MLKSFVSGNMAKLIGLLATATGAVAVAIGIFQQGKRSERVDELQQVNKQGAQAHAVEDTNRANLADGDAAGKLQTDWSR